MNMSGNHKKSNRAGPKSNPNREKGTKRDQNGARRIAKGSQGSQKGAKSDQKGAKRTKMEPKERQKGAKRRSKCINKSIPEKGRQKGDRRMYFWYRFGSPKWFKMGSNIDAKNDAEKVEKNMPNTFKHGVLKLSNINGNV